MQLYIHSLSKIKAVPEYPTMQHTNMKTFRFAK
jgi:hypothetical protein